MAISGKIALSANVQQTASRDLGAADDTAVLSAALRLTNGTGAGQADRLWSDTRTLAASATEDLDLSGTGLTDAFGTTVTFPKVSAVIVKAAPGNTNNVVVGAAATNAWATLLNATGTITLRPGAWVAIAVGEADASGYATTAGTGDLLRVANSGAGTAVSFDIIVVGKSA
jgi:hypothetical protein